MTFDDFRSDLEAWFGARYAPTEAEIMIKQDDAGGASITIACRKPDTPERVSFLIPWETKEDRLKWAQSVIERRTQTKAERRQQLMGVDINEEMGGWIDDFYTDFRVAEEDRECLERFLQSSNVDNRREALLALILTGPAGPKYTGYALDALVVHVLGIVEDEDAQFTGVSLLAELRNRGDKEAQSILESLRKNKKWRRLFME